jgi:glycosyltransferase involved in cell wall biosynthesis
MWVGKLSQRRNIPMLVSAFGEFKRRTGLPHALLLVGPNHLNLPLMELAGTQGVADSLVHTQGRLSDHGDLVPVYQAAEAFVSASSYEGYSMPVLEALACGTPVIGVDRAAVGEIARGAALLIENPDVSDLAEAMMSVARESTVRGELRERGLKRAAGFTWDVTARGTWEALRQVVDDSTRGRRAGA